MVSLCRDGSSSFAGMDGAPGAGVRRGPRRGRFHSLNQQLHSFELPNAHTMSGSPFEGGAGT